MARAIWTGSLSFGLVNVPVGLYSATEDKTVHFNQFQAGTSDRVRYKRVNEETGEEVAYDDIVKGYDIGGGEYVIVTPDELEAVEPGRSRTIDIVDFVDAAQIDPIYYQKTYYLAPASDDAGRAYGLLREAMSKARRIGIATLVMRSKQYLAAVRPDHDVLALETMFFADEVRDPRQELPTLPSETSYRSKDLDVAVSLIESMTSEWDPSSYHDTYRDRVMELIEAKRKGQEIVSDKEPEAASNVVDLMEALRKSVEQARSHRGGKPEHVAPVSRKDSDDARAAEPRRRASRAEETADDDLSELSKQQLYDRAQELDIAGRSKMTRAELAEAIRAAGHRKAS